MSILRRKNDYLLLAYQASVYGLLAALFLAFPRGPPWFKVLSYLVAALATQKYESPLHYAVHTPLFHQKYLNAIHRLSWCVFPVPAVLYRREHFHHHRHNNLGHDETTTLDLSEKRHVSIFTYVWRNIVSTRQFYRVLNRSERREAVAHLALCLALQVGLALYDPVTAFVFWLPVSWLVFPAMNAVFCYFGHVPGNPYNKYQASTYAPVLRPWQRVLCWLDFHNSAYHLTHHLFPTVHWSELHRVQKGLEAEYERRGSPRSLAFNSMILLNPFALLSTIWRVNRIRNATPMGSLPPPQQEPRAKVAARHRPDGAFRKPMRESVSP